jgi:hypothetical protein
MRLVIHYLKFWDVPIPYPGHHFNRSESEANRVAKTSLERTYHTSLQQRQESLPDRALTSSSQNETIKSSTSNQHHRTSLPDEKQKNKKTKNSCTEFLFASSVMMLPSTPMSKIKLIAGTQLSRKPNGIIWRIFARFTEMPKQ